MRNGLEARCPFLDIEVVNLARRIPARLKFRNGQTKWILKKAFEPILPRAVLNRPKKGFGIPIGKWFLNDAIFELGRDRTTSARYRTAYFRKRLEEHRSRKANHRLYLWNAWLLDHWLAR
jgi:asparagine synthase (glutamine-hydrolysing)